MNRINTYCLVSLLMLAIQISPILLSSITVSTETEVSSLYEDPLNDGRGELRDSKEEVEATDVEEFTCCAKSKWLVPDGEDYFSHNHGFGILYKDIFIPPPKHKI